MGSTCLGQRQQVADQDRVDPFAHADEAAGGERIVRKGTRHERAPAEALEGVDGTVGPGGWISERLVKLEAMSNKLQDDMERIEQRLMLRDNASKDQFASVLKSVETIARLVFGVGGDDWSPESKFRSTGDGEHGQGLQQGDFDAAVAGDDAVAWLDKRVQNLLAEARGMSLDGRIRELEKINAVGGGFEYRIAGLEKDIRSLGVPPLKQVQAELVDCRQEHQIFAQSLLRDVKELKAAVGRAEVCVPHEQRVAVDFQLPVESERTAPLALSQVLGVDGRLLAMGESDYQQIDTRLQELEAATREQKDAAKGVEEMWLELEDKAYKASHNITSLQGAIRQTQMVMQRHDQRIQNLEECAEQVLRGAQARHCTRS